jgi:ketosteroid isomerase-like protein
MQVEDPISNPIQVVLKFEELINSTRPEAISAFMTPDGEFIDSLGNRIQGVEKLRIAWTAYFKMVPDYSISHSDIFAHGNTVAVFGSAQGTFSKDGQLAKENYWKTPASWRAVVKDHKIAVWQVYADNEPIRAIMIKYK